MNTHKIIMFDDVTVLSEEGSKKLHELLDEYNSEKQMSKRKNQFITHNAKSPSKVMIEKILKDY